MIDENGLRMDGRKPGDLRPISIETRRNSVADGSCRMVWGTNEAIVAVYGPMEAHLEDPTSRQGGHRCRVQHGALFYNR